MWDEETLKDLVSGSYAQLANEIVKKIIARHAGCGIETEIKTMIKESAKKLLEDDEETKKLLKEQIIYWIKQQ